MEFDEIVKRQATHKLIHAGAGFGEEDQPDLSCEKCYLTKDISKHERFNRFWKLVEQLDLNVKGYSGQTIHAFNKLTELFYEKGKPNNTSLVSGIKAILTTIEYAENPQVDISLATY